MSFRSNVRHWGQPTDDGYTSAPAVYNSNIVELNHGTPDAYWSAYDAPSHVYSGASTNQTQRGAGYSISQYTHGGHTPATRISCYQDGYQEADVPHRFYECSPCSDYEEQIASPQSADEDYASPRLCTDAYLHDATGDYNTLDEAPEYQDNMSPSDQYYAAAECVTPDVYDQYGYYCVEPAPIQVQENTYLPQLTSPPIYTHSLTYSSSRYSPYNVQDNVLESCACNDYQPPPPSQHLPLPRARISTYSELSANLPFLLQDIKPAPPRFTTTAGMSVGASAAMAAPVFEWQPVPSQAPPKVSSRRRAADKKQSLACLFCRERKIACSRPQEGSEDQTCNQCARRQFICEYPKESLRGQHKRQRKVHIVDDAN